MSNKFDNAPQWASELRKDHSGFEWWFGELIDGKRKGEKLLTGEPLYYVPAKERWEVVAKREDNQVSASEVVYKIDGHELRGAREAVDALKQLLADQSNVRCELEQRNDELERHNLNIMAHVQREKKQVARQGFVAGVSWATIYEDNVSTEEAANEYAQRECGVKDGE